MPESLQQIEFMILDWIQAVLRVPAMEWIMPKITLLGNCGFIWIVLALVLLLQKPWRRCGMVMLLGLAGGALVFDVLMKNLVARARPCWLNPWVDILITVPRDYSFPSGHTLAGFTAAMVLMRYDKNRSIPVFVLAALIAFSRLFLYVHFPSDVLAGAIFGILTGIAADLLVDHFVPRRPPGEKKEET